jgi:hypothetical protein
VPQLALSGRADAPVALVPVALPGGTVA